MRAVFHLMEPRRAYNCILVLLISIIVTTLFTLCDARSFEQMLKLEASKLSRGSFTESITKLKASNHMDMDPTLGLSDSTESYGLSSPFSLPPFDSPAPLPLPENVPPFCVFPPSFTPQPPSTTVPPPRSHTPPPPPFHFTPTVPIKSPPPSPPISIPSPPTYSPSPNPPENVPGPPGVTPSPPYHGPSPPKLVPTPPVFQPPMVHPPPSAPAPPNRKPEFAVWCVAKPTVPDAIIQEALDYACGSGADCGSIRPNGSCFQPNTMYAHASYAFNSYWQRSKEAGGTCDFGGTAMLVTVDPRTCCGIRGWADFVNLCRIPRIPPEKAEPLVSWRDMGLLGDTKVVDPT